MYSSHKARKQEWKNDFDLIQLIPSALFFIGVTLMLIFSPTSTQAENKSRVMAASNTTHQQRAPLQKSADSKPVAPVAKPVDSSPASSDEDQPYFIASPDL